MVLLLRETIIIFMTRLSQVATINLFDLCEESVKSIVRKKSFYHQNDLTM